MEWYTIHMETTTAAFQVNAADNVATLPGLSTRRKRMKRGGNLCI